MVLDRHTSKGETDDSSASKSSQSSMAWLPPVDPCCLLSDFKQEILRWFYFIFQLLPSSHPPPNRTISGAHILYYFAKVRPPTLLQWLSVFPSDHLRQNLRSYMRHELLIHTLRDLSQSIAALWRYGKIILYQIIVHIILDATACRSWTSKLKWIEFTEIEMLSFVLQQNVIDPYVCNNHFNIPVSTEPKCRTKKWVRIRRKCIVCGTCRCVERSW